jgi:hypothetical protein
MIVERRGSAEFKDRARPAGGLPRIERVDKCVVDRLRRVTHLDREVDLLRRAGFSAIRAAADVRRKPDVIRDVHL